jgi:acyl carrier protein
MTQGPLPMEEFVRSLLGALRVEITAPPDVEASLVDELGFDSFRMLELAVVMEDEFGVTLTDVQLRDVQALEDAYFYYVQYGETGVEQ